MDVLADAMSFLRVGPARSARTEVRAPWGLRFPAITGPSFHAVLQGSCWLLPEAGGDPLPLGQGDVVFLRQGSAHGLADDPATPMVEFAAGQWNPASPIGQVRLVAGSGARSLLLCGAYRLGHGRPHPLLRELPDVVHLPARPGRHGALRSLVELLAVELDEPQPGRDGIVPALVDALLLYALRAWVDDRARDVTAGWAAALTDPGIATALAAMHTDPARAWSVADLAVAGGVSRSVFAQRFSTLVGQPPLAYLTWWRMTMAGTLLRSTDLPLRAVAERAGYSSEFAFAKAFKREFGVAPGRYRNQPEVITRPGDIEDTP